MGRNHAGAVYPIRPFLHAAISTDGGRHSPAIVRFFGTLLVEKPPHGDYGVAYSNGIENEDSVMFVSGQSAGHMGTMRIDPRWLLETGASANFSDSTAQGSWADTTGFTGDYVADCLFFPGVVPVYPATCLPHSARVAEMAKVLRFARPGRITSSLCGLDVQDRQHGRGTFHQSRVLCRAGGLLRGRIFRCKYLVDRSLRSELRQFL